MSESGGVTKAREDKARTAILDYMDKTKKSQATVGKELGYKGGSILSQFVSETYPTPHKVAARIEDLLKITEKKEVAPTEPGFKMTSISQKVTSLIELCHVQSQVGVAYGDPGVGKTMAVMQYAKENPKAIVITVQPTSATIMGVNEPLAAKLGIQEKLPRRMTAKIIEKLRGSNRILIIDEAQHLKARVVNHLRSIVDATGENNPNERIGMALVGNDEIFHELKTRPAAAYRQIGDRIPNWAHLTTDETTSEDIRIICSEANLDDESIKILHYVGRTVSVRQAIYVFVNTMSAFKIQDYADITPSKLARTAQEMLIRIPNLTGR